MTTVDWQLRRTLTGTIDEAIRDVRVIDAFNRFARRAEVLLEDPDGKKTQNYNSNEAVTLYVQRNIDPGWIRRFDGFVVDPVDDRAKATLDIYSHDLWLRRRNVFETYTNSKISTILEDLIKTYTPLNWEPSTVTVVNDRSVTREWRGERLDEVLSELQSISGGGEYFGATIRTNVATQFILGDITRTEGGGLGDNSLDTLNAGTLGDEATLGDIIFFFEPPTQRRAPRQFEDREYWESQFSRDSRREVNKVTVYYNGTGTNQKGLTVQDFEAQRTLQDALSAPRPVVVEKTKQYPEITNQEAARRKANKLLNETDAIQTAELDSWEGFNLKPGDIVRVQNSEKGIDKDFLIAELDYRWRDDKTIVKLAENEEGVIDVLVTLSTEITRVDNRQVDPSVQTDLVAQFNLPVETKLELEIIKHPVPADAFNLGEPNGGLGDPTAPSIDGGKIGDQRGDPETLVSG